MADEQYDNMVRRAVNIKNESKGKVSLEEAMSYLKGQNPDMEYFMNRNYDNPYPDEGKEGAENDLLAKQFLVDRYKADASPELLKIIEAYPIDDQLEILGALNKIKQQSGVAKGGIGMMTDVLQGTDKVLDVLQKGVKGLPSF